MGSDELRDRLDAIARTFDLGEYETDAYLAVLEHGTLSATECAEEAGVPQTRIYDVVRRLSDRGLVDLRDTQPMEVVAVDPEDALGEVEDSLSTVIGDLATRYQTPTREMEAASLVKSRRTILNHLGAVVESAEYELALSLTPQLLERFADDLAAARERGVAVELLVTPAAAAPAPDSFDYARVCTIARSRRGITTPVIAVADGRNSVFTTQDALREGRDRYGVIFNRSELGFLVYGFFNILLGSTTATTLHSDLDVGPYPRRYASMRRAIEDVQAHEGTVYAAIDGRDVQSGDQRRVEGEIRAANLAANGGVATLTVATDDGPVEVGGQVAAFEDVEAHCIVLGLDGVPAME